MIVKAGSTDVVTYVVLRKAADGTELTGATITDIDLVYTRSGADHATKVDATALATTASAHADNKAIEVDTTSAPGLYRVDWPDAAFATGVREVVLTVIYATAFTEHLRVELSPVAEEVWGYASRTLTQTAAAVTTAVSGSTLTVTRTVSYAATISGLTIPATWSKMLLTAKASTGDSDAASQIQIQESTEGTGDGLLYIDGKTPTTAGLVVGDASLTVSQAAGTIAIVIDDEATVVMVAGTYSYDVKCLLADGTSQQLSGSATLTIADGVTAAIV